jgi:hypothetical protein
VSNPRKEYYKELLTIAASDHLEFTSKASEASFLGDEKQAMKYQSKANNSFNTMLSLQRRIFTLEAAENNRKLRVVQ